MLWCKLITSSSSKKRVVPPHSVCVATRGAHINIYCDVLITLNYLHILMDVRSCFIDAKLLLIANNRIQYSLSFNMFICTFQALEITRTRNMWVSQLNFAKNISTFHYSSSIEEKTNKLHLLFSHQDGERESTKQRERKGKYTVIFRKQCIAGISNGFMSF